MIASCTGRVTQLRKKTDGKGNHGKGHLVSVPRIKSSRTSAGGRQESLDQERSMTDNVFCSTPKAETLQEPRKDAGGKFLAKWEGKKDDEGTVTLRRRGREGALGVLVGLAEPLVRHRGRPEKKPQQVLVGGPGNFLEGPGPRPTRLDKARRPLKFSGIP